MIVPRDAPQSCATPPLSLSIALDFGYDGMSARECASLATQTALCHHATKQHGEHVQFALVGAGSSVVSKELEALGIDSWTGVTQHPTLASIGRPLVYLSPDADVALGEEEDTDADTGGGGLDPNAVYVVGALIDRAVRPNASRARALEHGAILRKLPTRLLPTHSVVNANGKSVRLNALNVNAVVATLVEYTHCQDWTEAMLRGLGSAQRHVSLGGEAEGEGEEEEEDDEAAPTFTSTISTSPELLPLVLSWLSHDPIDLVALTATSRSLRSAALRLLDEAWLLRCAPDIELPPRCKPTFVGALPGGDLVVSNSTHITHRVQTDRRPDESVEAPSGMVVSEASVLLIRPEYLHDSRQVAMPLDFLDALSVKRPGFRPSGLAVIAHDDGGATSSTAASLLIADCASSSAAVLEQPLVRRSSSGDRGHGGSSQQAGAASSSASSSYSSFGVDHPLQYEQVVELNRLRLKKTKGGTRGLSAKEGKAYEKLAAMEVRWWNYHVAEEAAAEQGRDGQQQAEAASTLDYPLGVAIGERTGRIFVVDSDNHRIVALAPRGAQSSTPSPAILFEFGRSAPGQLQDPFDVAAHDGKLYVSDSGHSRICIYSEEAGQFLRCICDRIRCGGPGTRPWLDRERGVTAFLRPGHVLRLGGPPSRDAEDARVFWSRFDGRPGSAEAKDDFLTSLDDPSGITVHRGRLIVAMSCGRLLVLSSGALDDDPHTPVYVEQCLVGKGCKGSSGVCIDGQGRVVVANHKHGRLHVLQPIVGSG